MARIKLQLYTQPGSVEVMVNLYLKDGGTERITAVVDTGAEISLFPRYLLDQLEHQLIGSGIIEIEQAGIANQYFQAVEASMSLFLEDPTGSRSRNLQIKAWFADSDEALIGFDGVLDRCTLFLDSRQTGTGWIELDD